MPNYLKKRDCGPAVLQYIYITILYYSITILQFINTVIQYYNIQYIDMYITDISVK